MALPVTITGLAVIRRIVGPYKSSAGNYYLFGQDSTTATTLQAFKATDPSTSWASVATKTGFANDILGLAGVQNGDIIHLIVNDVQTPVTAWNYKYQTFDMSTDTFVTAETITSAINPTDSAGGLYGLCEIVFRQSDQQPLVFFPGPRVAGFASTNYKVRTGAGTWSAAVVVDPGAASSDYYPISIAPGASNSTHFVYMTSASSNSVNQKALTSANALQAEVALPAAYSTDGAGKGWSLINVVTTKVVFANKNGATGNGITGYFNSANVPTMNTGGPFGASGAMSDGARIYTDGSNFWALYTRTDTGDVYFAKSTNFGATWGTETLAMTASATASGPNGDEFLSFCANNTYARGVNNVVGYTVNDGGTLKYNEINVGDVLMAQGFM